MCVLSLLMSRACACLYLMQVVGVNMVEVEDADTLIKFFSDCFDSRAVGATMMNSRSSRSHAIYTVLINRTIVDVSEGCDKVRSTSRTNHLNVP